ncbi:hypothetical protein ACQP2F_15865 [Actinoplanes sp. CA-030573]|uniref:hypothetical protein n=1 Tax=Actinoplanes sp. CA-030573 TaxID=3239898 RepID=UPI003D946615
MSHAYGLWTPGKFDTCSKSFHDTFWVYGPDGKVYPTWHPPVAVDPATGKKCTFGHEHGDDPSKSAIKDVDLPFGYINEQLEDQDPNHPRHEDHVGHKVTLVNNVVQDDGTKCSALVKLHQGTHSADAFTNNMHEVMYYISCTDGLRVVNRSMHHFGVAGTLSAKCIGDVRVGDPTPSTSIQVPNESGRKIGSTACLPGILQTIREGKDASSQLYDLLREDWFTGRNVALHVDNSGQYHTYWGQQGFNHNDRQLLQFGTGTYFQVDMPSRLFDDQTKALYRTVNICKIPEIADKNPCFFQNRAGNDIPWDDPRSAFNGSVRTVHLDTVNLCNRTDQTEFYSNAMGTELRPRPDAARGITISQEFDVPARFRDRCVQLHLGDRSENFSTAYGASGIHAPN